MSNKNRHITKDKVIKYGINSFSKVIIDNFNAWMKASTLTETNLKIFANSLHSISPVLEKRVDGAYVVALTGSLNGSDILAGIPLISPSKNNNKEFLLDSALMLCYVARLMDSYKTTDDDKGNLFFDSIMKFADANNVFQK